MPGRGGETRLRLVVVGGVDPSGGAGLLRDVATAASLGADAYAIGTAWTEQGNGVHDVEPRGPGAVGAALARALRDVRPAAVKIGMAVGPSTAEALLDALRNFAGPVVVDPVLATSRGGALWEAPPSALLPLLRRATLATPNAPEAALLAGRPVGQLADAEAAGRSLVHESGVAAVLIKGGHLGVASEPVTDVLVTAAETQIFRHARVAGPSPRGTGCALATALAVALAQGQALEAAVQTATAWLLQAIVASRTVGSERHLGG